jgi:hypothetical protein
MDPAAILYYGNRTVLGTVESFPAEHAAEPGACGWWSVKDLLAHLTSFEWVLVDILNGLIDPGPTPYLDLYTGQRQDFNDSQVILRQGMDLEAVLAEYLQAHERVNAALPHISPETWRRKGILPWYGEEYDLEDFIVYTYYGHKREHCGQIAVFADQFK